eukprot:XP_001702927.1 predicted protein [Chlamydomonas reinhardtii]
MQLQKRAAGLRAASSRRSTVRVCAQAQVATVTARPAVRSVEHEVKFTLKQKVGLGECWKIVGMCPELGRMKPEVAPYMQWTNGDVWTLEAKMRPGTYEFKAVLRKPDGSYLWEDGKDRVLEVPFGASGKNVELTNIKFPGA